MKLILAFLFLPIYLFSQEIKTTNEEYLYLTKGLKRHLEEGTDSKVGYTLKNQQPSKFGNYEFTLRPFIKDDTQKLVAISVVAKGAWGTVYYLCIPIDNPELFVQYQKEIDKWDAPMTKAYAQLTSYLMAQSMAFLESLDKK